MSPVQNRLAAAAAKEEAPAPAFLHAALAQVSLPYRDPKVRDYIRTCGAATLIVTAGHLLNPTTGRPALQGVPYGARPRLLLLHLCAEAVRRQSPTVPIGRTLSAFMGELGLAVTGGATGTIGRFRDQLNRLAGARVQIMIAQGARSMTLNPAPIIARHELLASERRAMWPSELTLSSEFFASLREHALPLNPVAIHALQHTARGLDLYAWAAHRLHRIASGSGLFLSWRSLQAQFGPDVHNLKDFRRDCLIALAQVQAVYRAARMEPVEGGVRFRRSPPPVPTLTVRGAALH